MFGRKRNWENQYDEYYAERPQRAAKERVALWIHITFLLTIAVVLELIVWGVHGRPMAERMLKQLATPIGIVWLGLLLQTYFAFARRAAATAISSLLLWLILTGTGNYYFKQFITRWAEADYGQRLPWADDRPLAAIVVLGGGTKSNLDGWSHLSRSGDRVMTALRIFERGLTPLIITTGEQTSRTDPKDLDPNQETKNILEQCGVPSESVVMLPGINTSQEITAVKEWLSRHPELSGQRLGIVSSAWHLPRVAALVADNDLSAAGVQVELIPADFLSAAMTPDPSMIIPAAENLEIIAKLGHEWLGRFIGR